MISLDRNIQIFNNCFENDYVFVFLFDWTGILNTKAQLDKLNSSLAQLQSSIDQVQTNVTNVKNQINQTLLNANCFDCSDFSQELQKLTVDLTISVSTNSGISLQFYLLTFFFFPPEWMNHN